MALKSKLRISALVFVCFLIASCKFYSLSFSGTSIPLEVETFSVSFIENNAPINSPLLSQSFTEKLKQKFIQETRLGIEERNGDFDFSGEILSYVVAPVSAQSTDNAQLNRLTITARIKLVCPINPKLEFDQSFTNFSDFDATQNFSSLEERLNIEITDMLVQQIFNKAAINW